MREQHEASFPCLVCPYRNGFTHRLSTVQVARHPAERTSTQSVPEHDAAHRGGILRVCGHGTGFRQIEADPEAGKFLQRQSLPVLLVASLAALLSACAAPRMAAESPPQTVQLDGLAYPVEQITVSTWTVVSPPALPNGPQKTASLVKAIEKASGCKVTDSSYGRQGTALHAQVDCGNKLKN